MINLTLLLFFYATCGCDGKPLWTVSDSSDDLFYMHYSENPIINAPRDNLVIWIGPAASGPRVEGKHGEMALPAAWGPFLDVLFVNFEPLTSITRGCSSIQTDRLWGLLMSKFNDYTKIYFAGVWTSGGSCLALLSLGKPVDAPHEIGGTMILDPPTTPTAVFISHSSLQSGNGELSYSTNRASQDVVCNADLSSVAFVMDDVHLHYTRKDRQYSNEDIVYALEQAQIPGVGCYNQNEFIKAMTGKPRAEGDEKRGPYLPDSSLRLQACSADGEKCVLGPSVDESLGVLLREPIGKVLLLRTLRHNHQLICSFYIGIFVSQGVRFDDCIGANYVNRAPLEEIWPWGDEYPLGETQGPTAHHSNATGQVLWAHANTAESWSRRGALRLLSLLKGDIGEIDVFIAGMSFGYA